MKGHTKLTPEIENRINLLMQNLPLYGEFTFDPEITKNIQLIEGIISIVDPDKRSHDSKDKVKKVQEAKEDLQLDEDTIQYLIFHGFVINRHDIKQEGVIYRQLTDEGRKLKEAGSLNWYKQKKRFFLGDKGMDYIRTLGGILLGALLTYFLQTRSTSKVYVVSPKQVFQVVHDTIQLQPCICAEKK